MNKAVPIVDEGLAGLYPIRTVAQLTGVNAITLRAWENRYSLIVPVRKESGHRLYSQEHIDLINKVVGLLDRGMRIGEVKPYLDAEATKLNDTTHPLTDTWRNYVEGMIASIIRFDEASLDSIYSEALAHHSIKQVTQRLIEPLLAELGLRWRAGTGTIAEEHFFCFYIRNKLGARFHHRTHNAASPRLLMACLPGEQHETGLLLFGLAVNEAGYHPVVLGADMPVEEMPAAAIKADCQGVILSGYLSLGNVVTRRALGGMAKQSKLPVMMGGPASVQRFDELRSMGVEPLGADIEAALKRLAALVPLRP